MFALLAWHGIIQLRQCSGLFLGSCAVRRVEQVHCTLSLWAANATAPSSSSTTPRVCVFAKAVQFKFNKILISSLQKFFFFDENSKTLAHVECFNVLLKTATFALINLKALFANQIKATYIYTECNFKYD